jgi:predicted dehydrogenase
MAPIKVGIVGYGCSTNVFHLPFILPNPDLEVYAFLQRAAPPSDPAQAPRWGHCTIDFPQAKHYRTADEFYADEQIELVVVCTSTHEEFVEKALLAGKHGKWTDVCQPGQNDQKLMIDPSCC